MAIKPDKFAKIADSLRQYRRAQLLDFQAEVGKNPVELLYVDPLESDAILKTILLNNTTFLVGRKGTGKSTVFAKAQADLRARSDAISAYVDVKSLHELIVANEAPVQAVQDASISEPVYRAHLLRKSFLSSVIADLIKEVKKAYEARSLVEKWVGKARSYSAVIAELEKIADDVKSSKLSEEEIPILRTISKKLTQGSKSKGSISSKVASNVKAAANVKAGAALEASASGEVEVFDEKMADNELYEAYSDAVLRSFPFQDLLGRIRELLKGAGLVRLFVFFDDFSELTWVDQKLFVDVILSPLNNASDETIKLKVAGYPGRIYYGKIDPGKVDTVGLDFYQLYKSQDIQTGEASAINYLERLLRTRFEGFGQAIEDYFDPSFPMTDHFRLLFEITLNVPRLIGYVLHYCYLDRISKRQLITGGALRLAALKYYETVVSQYFDRTNRFALEPFERKLDRHNQQQLLQTLIGEVRKVRKGILAGDIGGTYFAGMRNPPVSHFAVSPAIEKLLSPLELNFLLTKYHEMRDKNGKDVAIYALFTGLCESERFAWGYPTGRRDDRSYFVQRCFNYNAVIEQFLKKNQTIRCDNCGACFEMEKRESIEFYKWRCPECHNGTCSVVPLGDDVVKEVEALENANRLPLVELDILETLNEEGVPMRAGDIASLVDATYQLVGHRTAKLQEMGLVQKSVKDSVNLSRITKKAQSLYFSTTAKSTKS